MLAQIRANERRPRRRPHPSGPKILIYGIVGLLICAPLAPFAWFKGSNARLEMKSQPDVQWTNRRIVLVGWVLGMIGTIAWALSAIAGVAYAVRR